MEVEHRSVEQDDARPFFSSEPLEDPPKVNGDSSPTTVGGDPVQERHPGLLSTKKKSVGEDSAYVTGPGSADCSSDDDDTHETSRPGTTTTTSAASTLADSRRKPSQRRSWAGQTSLSATARLAAAVDRRNDSDDEATGRSPTDVRGPAPHEFKILADLPAFAMVGLAHSTRRTLGRKRSTVTPPPADALDVAPAETPPPPTSLNPPIHRAPSSLFYLQYDDDDEATEDDKSGGRRRPSRSDLPSSRKLSAAAYMNRADATAPADGWAPAATDDEYAGAVFDVDETAFGRGKRLAIQPIREALSRGQAPEGFYEDTMKQIDALTKVFRVGDDVYRNMMNVLNTEMDRGLQKANHHEATVKMFHTFVRRLPDGTEFGRYVALDLGGTNFRVLLVDLAGRQQPSVESSVFLIPMNIMLGTGNMLFDHIATCIAEFLDKRGLKNERLPMGFTFSFPCIQDGLASARLARWTKGFRCSGVENEDVVRLLNEAIRRRGDLNLECVAIINDNVGVLMAGAHADPNCRIGLILGTGTNCCYVEQLEKIEMWNGAVDEPKQMIVNTEWGAFGDDGVLDFVRNEYDRQLDEISLNPGHQLFEKMISGMYMGEIVRLVLCELSMRGLLFNGQGSEELFEPQRFYTKYISEIESDDPAGDYLNTKQVLQELDITDFTMDDCRHVQHVCWQVSQRAAFLAATAAAVVIKRVNLPEVTVAVDGSLYRFHPHFKDLMRNKISKLVDPEQEFKLILANDGSGQGAALVAATAVGDATTEQPKDAPESVSVTIDWQTDDVDNMR